MSILKDRISKDNSKIEKVLEVTMDEWLLVEDVWKSSNWVYRYPCIYCLVELHIYKDIISADQGIKMGYYLLGGGTHIIIDIIPDYSYYS